MDDGWMSPKLIGFINGMLRSVLWLVFWCTVIAGPLSLFVPGSTPETRGTSGIGWVFLTVTCVLAILYTLDHLILAVRDSPDANAEALRRTKPKTVPPPLPTDTREGWDMVVDPLATAKR